MNDARLVSLLETGTNLRVSSTLEKSAGKRNLIDKNPETCWTSQQGLPQYIQVNFQDRVNPLRLSLTFQGGFVGTRCAVQAQCIGSSEWRSLTGIYPEDVNRQQTFDLPVVEGGDGVTALKLVFEQSSDFFGRITIYDLGVEGLFIE